MKMDSHRTAYQLVKQVTKIIGIPILWLQYYHEQGRIYSKVPAPYFLQVGC